MEDMNDLMAAADERRFWKDVGKIAYGLGRKDVVDFAHRKAREIGTWMVEQMHATIAERKE